MVVHSAQEGVIKAKQKWKTQRLREKLSHVKAEESTPVNITHKLLMLREGRKPKGRTVWASYPCSLHALWCYGQYTPRTRTQGTQSSLGLLLHLRYHVVSLANLQIPQHVLNCFRLPCHSLSRSAPNLYTSCRQCLGPRAAAVQLSLWGLAGRPILSGFLLALLFQVAIGEIPAPTQCRLRHVLHTKQPAWHDSSASYSKPRGP